MAEDEPYVFLQGGRFTPFNQHPALSFSPSLYSLSRSFTFSFPFASSSLWIPIQLFTHKTYTPILFFSRATSDATPLRVSVDDLTPSPSLRISLRNSLETLEKDADNDTQNDLAIAALLAAQDEVRGGEWFICKYMCESMCAMWIRGGGDSMMDVFHVRWWKVWDYTWKGRGLCVIKCSSCQKIGVGNEW